MRAWLTSESIQVKYAYKRSKILSPDELCVSQNTPHACVCAGMLWSLLFHTTSDHLQGPEG